jgi:phosphoribosylanthranilate isomerase
VLVQIYGLTVVSDAVAVDTLGADFIGVVLDEGISTWDSVDEQTAREITTAVTTSRVVALSLSTDPIRIKATADLLRPAVVHLARAHLMPTEVLDKIRSSIDAELMLTVPVQSMEALTIAERLEASADYLLLDSRHPETGVVGATGLVHDWDLSAAVVASVGGPVLLAGGLGPHNVRQAIERVRPAGVDSETRTSKESDRRRKDLEKVRAFIETAKDAG